MHHAQLINTYGVLLIAADGTHVRLLVILHHSCPVHHCSLYTHVLQSTHRNQPSVLHSSLTSKPGGIHSSCARYCAADPLLASAPAGAHVPHHVARVLPVLEAQKPPQANRQEGKARQPSKRTRKDEAKRTRVLMTAKMRCGAPYKGRGSA